MRLTAFLIAAIGLLAVCQLAAPAHGARQLLRSRDERLQAEREAEQLADQQAELEVLVADGTQQHQEQQAEEQEKLEDQADAAVVEQQQQLADQQQKLAELAEEEGAAEAEQEQLDRAARKAARKAERAARREAKRKEEEEAAADSDSKHSGKDGKAARQSDREAEAAAAQAAQAADEAAVEPDDKEAARAARQAAKKAAKAAAEAAAEAEHSSGSGDSSDGDDRDSSDPRRPSHSGPIWGKFHSRGKKGGEGFAYATYHYYAPGYETSSLYCADMFNKFLPVEPDHWLLEYPWTAYCNDEGLGPMQPSYCGRCLKATNPETGDSVKLRVVDMCGQGGVDIDPLGFNALDGNGAGVRDGSMNLILQWC